jgi:sugar-specific transcriptional regulator TrmB
MLSALGLQADEEEIYRRLVTHVSASVAELAMLTGHAVADVAGVLANLVARGLAAAEPSVETPGVTTVFTAAPPAVALGGLLRQRRDDLHTAEQDLAALVEEHRVSAIGRTTSNVVEEITDISAVRHRFAQIQEAAQYEVLAMVRPNLSVVPHRDNMAEMAGLRRGVRYRAILDRRALLQPGMVNDVIDSIRAGQEIRIADRVPVKLMIVDRERAMLPLLHDQNSAPESVLVQSSGLLDALIAFFEMAWEQAYPLLANSTGQELVETRPEIDELDSRILALLLSGMTDQAVAGQLGSSRRTVQRRIHDLMVKAGAETRIELGWYAARKGWA